MDEHEGKEKMVKILKALANPVRLKMIALLCEEPKHVYGLSKELEIPYPLAHLHLSGLKKRGLVKEVREEKRAGGLPSVKYYSPSEFEFILTPENIHCIFSSGDHGGDVDG